MSSLADFRQRSFLEQMRLLSDPAVAGDPANGVALCELVAQPLGDAAVDILASGKLREQLATTPSLLLHALHDASPRLLRLAVHAAGDTDDARVLSRLLDMAEQAEDDGEDVLLLDVLAALSRRHGGKALSLLRRHARNPDPLVAGLCLRALGELGDVESLSAMAATLERAAAAPSSRCEAPVWSAVEGLEALARGDNVAVRNGALEVLASQLRHPNPTARRLVHDALTSSGASALPWLEAPLLTSPDPDAVLMAVNLLGRLGLRQGLDMLFAARDQGRLQSPVLRFALYEALGAIPSLRSVSALLDAWNREDDAQALLSLVLAVARHYQPALADKFRAPLHKADPARRQAMFTALLHAGDAPLLHAVVQDDALRRLLLDGMENPDARQLSLCLAALEGAPEAEADRRTLSARLAASSPATPAAPGLLAVDDSLAMRSFYQSAGEALGMPVHVAEHGRQALDLLLAWLRQSPDGSALPARLAVVDMNMPVMDGVELVQRLREQPALRDFPVIMATTESAPSQVNAARQAGVCVFLKKPFTMQTLHEAIRSVLRP